MPSHNHEYSKFYVPYYFLLETSNQSFYYAPAAQNHEYLESTKTGYCGGSKSHNNMPPFLTANCWKRTG